MRPDIQTTSALFVALMVATTSMALPDHFPDPSVTTEWDVLWGNINSGRVYGVGSEVAGYDSGGTIRMKYVVTTADQYGTVYFYGPPTGAGGDDTTTFTWKLYNIGNDTEYDAHAILSNWPAYLGTKGTYQVDITEGVATPTTTPTTTPTPTVTPTPEGFKTAPPTPPPTPTPRFGYSVTSSEFSMYGGYKSGGGLGLVDIGGQPPMIGAWQDQTEAGGGWIYTVSWYLSGEKDHDHDGMPYAYENQFSEWMGETMLYDWNAWDAFSDQDGDGFTNIQEYLSKTDPTDSSQFLSFTDVRIVNAQGGPALVWWNPTTEISGYKSQYPAYPNSLRYDILYADWPAQSQANRAFPSPEWFNLTGTWNVLAGATDLRRDGSSEFTAFTDEYDSLGLSSLNDGDIRFFRLAIHDTYLEGDLNPSSDYNYQSNFGSYKLASTLAREVLLVQKHDLAEASYYDYGLAGINPGGGGKLDYALGTSFFKSGPIATLATNINFWRASGGPGGKPDTMTSDYLSNAGTWWQSAGVPSTRTIEPEEPFRYYFQVGLPDYPYRDYYAGAQLKLDSYYHQIYKCDWVLQSDSGPGAPYAQNTWIAYNYPVCAALTDLDHFPHLAGTTTPSVPGLECFESDWVFFFNRNISSLGSEWAEYTCTTVVIYYDHGPNDRWEYYYPAFGEEVKTELVISPGSPFVVHQYWNPDEPEPWNSSTMRDSAPCAAVKTYLQFE